MASGTGKGDVEFLKSAYAWAGDMGASHNCGVRVSMVPTKRQGIWKLTAAACDVVDARIVAVRCKVEAEYPSAQAQTLAGAIFALLVKLDAACGPTPLEEASQA